MSEPPESTPDYSRPPQIEPQKAAKRESDKAGNLIGIGFVVAYLGFYGMAFASTSGTLSGKILGVLGSLALTIPLLAGFALKLKQVGRDWKWAFVLYVPCLGLIVLCFLCYQKSKPVPNGVAYVSPSNYPRFEDKVPDLETVDPLAPATKNEPPS